MEFEKYRLYKKKYLKLKKQLGGVIDEEYRSSIAYSYKLRGDNSLPVHDIVISSLGSRFNEINIKVKIEYLDNSKIIEEMTFTINNIIEFLIFIKNFNKKKVNIDTFDNSTSKENEINYKKLISFVDLLIKKIKRILRINSTIIGSNNTYNNTYENIHRQMITQMQTARYNSHTKFIEYLSFDE